MGFLTKHKKMFVTTTVIICAALMAYSIYFRARPTLAEDVLNLTVNPFSRFFTNVGGGVSKFFASFADAKNLRSENERLRNDITELTAQNERLVKIESEYESLTRLLEITQIYAAMDMLGVTVIGKDPGLWYSVFRVDKGRGAGVDANMPVIASGGLIGRVIEAGYDYAKVRSLLDETFAVSVKTVRTGDGGVVKGDMKLKEDGLCKMERIDIHADVAAGDEIVTSNLGAIYPPGITVGFVKEVNISADGLSKTAVVAPGANFKDVTHCLVVLNAREGGGAPPENLSE